MALIIVVEDVPAVRISLQVALEGAGHMVRAAAGTEAGLALLRAGGADLVVTDIWMPGRTGADMIAEGRQLAPQTRFLAVTGGAPNGSITPGALVRGGQSFGADRVLFKPFRRGEITAAVADLLRATA